VTALEFDADAYAASLVLSPAMFVFLQEYVGLLCDFFKIDRREIV
jgi:hypothetical protein